MIKKARNVLKGIKDGTLKIQNIDFSSPEIDNVEMMKALAAYAPESIFFFFSLPAFRL